jgi:hypothetical protein
MKNFLIWSKLRRIWPDKGWLASHRRYIKAAAIISLPLLAMTVLAVRQFYILPSKKALVDLQTKLSASRSMKYDGTIRVIGRDFLSAMNSQLTFGGDFARVEGGFKLDSSFGGSWLNKDYTGEALMADGKLNFRLAGENLPVIRFNQTLSTYNITGDWHTATLDNNLYMWACETRPDSEYPTALDIVRFYRSLELNNSWLVGFSQPVAGHRTTHFKGSVEKESLQAALKKLDESLPGSCHLPLVGQGAENLTARYDLWTSTDFDRFKLVITDEQLGVDVELQTDLHSYNQPAEFVRPGPSIDLDELRRQAVGR